jgi:hypothetical protein
MKPVRIAFVLLVILLVVGALVAVSSETNLLVTTRTDRFTTTSFLTITSILNHTTTVSVYGNVELTGYCTAAHYFIPDTISAAPSTVTFTSGNATSYSVTYTTVYQNSTVGTETYSASTFVNDTITLVVTTTSTNPNYFPSDWWTVTVCTFAP